MTALPLLNKSVKITPLLATSKRLFSRPSNGSLDKWLLLQSVGIIASLYWHCQGIGILLLLITAGTLTWRFARNRNHRVYGIAAVATIVANARVVLAQTAPTAPAACGASLGFFAPLFTAINSAASAMQNAGLSQIIGTFCAIAVIIIIAILIGLIVTIGYGSFQISQGRDFQTAMMPAAGVLLFAALSALLISFFTTTAPTTP